jgi:hypothetical protein
VPQAQEARERLRNKPLESPHMHFLLERCSRVHQLKKGQVSDGVWKCGGGQGCFDCKRHIFRTCSDSWPAFPGTSNSFRS